MTKAKWFKHIDTLVLRPSMGGNKEEYKTFIKSHIESGCQVCRDRLKTKHANQYAKDKREVYASLGMKRVVGALGGVYYE